MQQQEYVQLFTLANEFKEGDLLAGGTRDAQTRKVARERLAALRIGEINRVVFVEDEVSEMLMRSLNQRLAAEIAHLTIAELKQRLLRADAANFVRQYQTALSSETIAAVVKLMDNQELAAVSHKIFNPLTDERHAIGSSSHFGARIQPNSPGDDEEEILFSILEGLSYGCGDVILGLNPASDDIDTIIRLEELLRQVKDRLELPTRYCVLCDIVKQNSARAGARIDVGFQSLAGT